MGCDEREGLLSVRLAGVGIVDGMACTNVKIDVTNIFADLHFNYDVLTTYAECGILPASCLSSALLFFPPFSSSLSLSFTC